MKLYEIQPEIDRIIRESIDDDGQIIDGEKLNSISELEMTKEIKCLNVAYAYKNTRANVDMIKTEIARLKRMQEIQSNKADSIKKYLSWNLVKGETYKDVKVSIKWNKSSSVHVKDVDALPEKYKRIKEEADLTYIRNDLDKGAQIVGCEIVEDKVLGIK